MEGEQYDVVPPLDQLDRRVRRFRVTFADPMHFLVRDEGSFGDTSEAAALRIVESIAGDPDRQRLLVEIGRAHVCTPVTNAKLGCRLLLAKKKNKPNSTQKKHIKYI